MADRFVDTSKLLASRRQIDAAILHYQNGAFECAITLAHAGENVIGKLGIVSFFDKLKEKMFDTDHNMFANWLKHPSGPTTATISELEVVVMIQRAISKFAAVAGGATAAMKNFSDAQLNKLQSASKA